MWQHTIDCCLKGERFVSRAGETREVVGHGFTLLDPDKTFLCNPRRKLDPHYACAEFLWYMAFEQHIRRIQAYAPQYQNFANDGIAHGAYGHRMSHNAGEFHQLKLLLETLRAKPNSRQAIVTLWNAKDDLPHASDGTKNDLPCTLTFQFLVRRGYLDMITTMRSEDAWLGLPYDVFCNMLLQRVIATELSLRVGRYHHCVGSMHLYEKHFEAAEEALSVGPYARLGNKWGGLSLKETIRVCGLENDVRLGRTNTHVIPNDLSQAAQDLLGCCAHKWGTKYLPCSQALTKGLFEW
jgi:thymidylate synthase